MEPDHVRALRASMASLLDSLEEAGVLSVEYEWRPGMGRQEGIRTPQRIQLLGAHEEHLRELQEAAGDAAPLAVAPHLTASRRAIVEGLQAAGGFVEDEDGRATARLAALLNPAPVHLGQALLRLEEEGIIIRRKVSKRVYSIALVHVPEEWGLGSPEEPEEPEPIEPEPEEPEEFDGPEVLEPEREEPTEPEPADAPEPSPEEEERPPESQSWRELLAPEPPVVITGPAPEDVAAHLLSLVLETVSKANGAPEAHQRTVEELAVASHRLYEQTEYAARLRTQLSEAVDVVKALTMERDGLRSRLRGVEANLAALMRDQGRTTSAAFREGQAQALDRFIRETPKVGAGN